MLHASASMTKRMRARWLLVLLASGLAGCGRDNSADEQDQHVVMYDSSVVHLVTPRDTLRLRVELAKTRDQRTMGLMERHHLAEDAGMLFVFDSTQAPDAGFWMFRTRIPLDIAYLDSSGTIAAIKAMVPCTTTLAAGCRTYDPGVPYRYALEVNSGYFARHGVALGSSIIPIDLAAARGVTSKR